MDEGRWEPFETCHSIHGSLKRTYEAEGYKLIEVPPGTVEERVTFMLKHLRDH